MSRGNVKETSEKLIFEYEGRKLPYRLIMPEIYDESKSYPLLMFFHGAGERGDDNELQLFHCVQYLSEKLSDCFIVAPQCPNDDMWVTVDWSKGGYKLDETPESKVFKAVIALIDVIKMDFSVDSDRIYAAGLSMGGYGVWDIMTRHSDIFAAGIAICGGGDASKAEILKEVPMFVFHGDADGAVPVSGSRDMVKAIRDAGGSKIEYTEFPGGGHGIWNEAFAAEGLLEKLMNCRLSDR